MLSRRVIVCLDVRDGRVVKGTQFATLRDVGDPVELAERYEREGADEIVFPLWFLRPRRIFPTPCLRSYGKVGRWSSRSAFLRRRICN